MTKENKVLDKKFHNICARFFGTDNMKDENILRFMTKVKYIYLCELSKIEIRIGKIEKKVYDRGKHYSEDGTEVRRNYKHQCNSKCEILARVKKLVKGYQWDSSDENKESLEIAKEIINK